MRLCRFVVFCSIANFACMEGHVYCRPHFMEIFMTKGETLRQEDTLGLYARLSLVCSVALYMLSLGFDFDALYVV